ncbi:MAG: hypothetical protein ABSH56_09250 [Bryobacteraceae bacterium]
MFPSLVEDFVADWPFTGQRARLARMFKHQRMRDAAFAPKDKRNPTQAETQVVDVITAFGLLQGDRHRADYDMGWKPVGTDVADAITLAESAFANWRAVRVEVVAREHLLSMFGAKR